MYHLATLSKRRTLSKSVISVHSAEKGGKKSCGLDLLTQSGYQTVLVLRFHAEFHIAELKFFDR
jgi:hypothetical protein